MPNVIDDMIVDIQGGLPAGGRAYMQQVTLPSIECENCTLQVTQLMTDKAPYSAGPTSDDIYYQCADIRLANAPSPGADAGVDPTSDAGSDTTSSTSGGCATSSDGALPTGLVLLSLVWRKRRKKAKQ
jgi:MYXO-CTERM domain-containing protein